MTVITRELVVALQPRSKRYEVTCSARPGFQVRCYPNGTISYTYRTRTNGKVESIPIGHDYDSACRAYQELAERRDYSLALDKANREGKPMERPATFFHLIDFLELQDKWLEQHVDRRLASSTAKAYREHLRGINSMVVLPRSSTETEVRKALRAAIRTKASKTPIQANRYLSTLQSMFTWAVHQEFIERTPLYNVPREVEQPRHTRLNPEELTQYIAALMSSPMQSAKAEGIKLVLLTGLRSCEVRAIRYDWIDWEAKILVIPEDVSKNGKAHAVPMTQTVIDLLRLRVESVGRRKRLFDTSSWGIRQASHRLSHKASCTVVGIHDLRRTHATMCGRLGTPSYIISRVLNHSVVGITDKVYNLYDNVKEKLEAYQLIEADLLARGLGVGPQGEMTEWERLTPADLVQLVWSKPAKDIGRQFGVSGSAVSKKCRVWAIEKPETGFWRKVETGKVPDYTSVYKADKQGLSESAHIR